MGRRWRVEWQLALPDRRSRRSRRPRTGLYAPPPMSVESGVGPDRSAARATTRVARTTPAPSARPRGARPRAPPRPNPRPWTRGRRRSSPPRSCVPARRRGVQRLETPGEPRATKRRRFRRASRRRDATAGLHGASGCRAATMGLRRTFLRGERRDGAGHRPAGGHRDRAPVMGELERRPLQQRVAGLPMGDLDPQPPPAKAHAEGQPGQSLG